MVAGADAPSVRTKRLATPHPNNPPTKRPSKVWPRVIAKPLKCSTAPCKSTRGSALALLAALEPSFEAEVWFTLFAQPPCALYQRLQFPLTRLLSVPGAGPQGTDLDRGKRANFAKRLVSQGQRPHLLTVQVQQAQSQRATQPTDLVVLTLVQRDVQLRRVLVGSHDLYVDRAVVPWIVRTEHGRQAGVLGRQVSV
jgi:hypothetical protein